MVILDGPLSYAGITRVRFRGFLRPRKRRFSARAPLAVICMLSDLPGLVTWFLRSARKNQLVVQSMFCPGFSNSLHGDA